MTRTQALARWRVEVLAMPTLRSLLPLLALLTATSSCAAPLQNGGVVVSPGADARLDLMCRYRTSGGSDAQEVCAAPPDE